MNDTTLIISNQINKAEIMKKPKSSPKKNPRAYTQIRNAVFLVYIFLNMPFWACHKAVFSPTSPEAVVLEDARDILVAEKDEDLTGYRFLAEIDALDGPENMRKDCNCKHPHLEQGTMEGAILTLKQKAAGMGGNLVQIRDSEIQDHFVMHQESCCYTVSYRVYGAVYQKIKN